eukprot:3024458-Amphidinium_carterae.1
MGYAILGGVVRDLIVCGVGTQLKGSTPSAALMSAKPSLDIWKLTWQRQKLRPSSLRMNSRDTHTTCEGFQTISEPKDTKQHT